MDVFNLGFESIDYSNPENHIYRFMTVDAHALQHPEVHGRWSNHFHLMRQYLILELGVSWHYGLSPRLSDHLNQYKSTRLDERLIVPPPLERGKITVTDISNVAKNRTVCQEMIMSWSKAVYEAWHLSHRIVAPVAEGFLS